MKFKLVENTYEGTKTKYFTNGTKSIKLKPGDIIPDGYHEGRVFNSNPWNKGLSSDDERVRKNIQSVRNSRIKNGTYDNPWNKGLTKETDDRLKSISKRISSSSKGRSAWNKGIPASEERKKKQSISMVGKTPWNKGLTKETNDSILSTSLKLQGHECFVKDWDEAKKKEYITKKKNNSFNTSKIENELFNNLKAQYGEDNVISQYRDDRYPYNCDLYIIPEDLFIEVNGTIEHNGHPFDKTNPTDIEESNRILEKAKEKGPSSRYWNIYRWWTEIDPKKLDTFRRNNLNFKIIYPNGLIIDK